jgi:hypothetical protein
VRSPIDRLVEAGSRNPARAKNFSPSKRSSLRRDVLSLLRDNNAMIAPERQVTYLSAARVVNRALDEFRTLEPEARRLAAIRALSAFLSLAARGAREGVEPRNTDLLPVGHPSSTAPHAMTASALRRSQAQWLSVDPEIAPDARPLVAAAFSYEPGSVEADHARARLAALPPGSVPAVFVVGDPLKALIADGNSRAARSARARAQRRDRKGRFAEMGAPMRFRMGLPGGGSEMTIGRVVGYPNDGSSLDLQLPDGSVVRVPANKTEGAKAMLPDTALPDGVDSDGPDDAITSDFETVVPEMVGAPAGWRKDESASSDGIDVFTDDEYTIARYSKIDKELGARVNKAGGVNQKNPGTFDLRGGGADPSGKWNKDLPLYEIRSTDGSKRVVGYAQDWADTLGIVEDNSVAADAKKAADADAKAKAEIDDAATAEKVAAWSKKRQAEYDKHVYTRTADLEDQVSRGVDASGRSVPDNWSAEFPETADSPRKLDAPGSAEERSQWQAEQSNPDAAPSFDKRSTDFIDDLEFTADLNGDTVRVKQGPNGTLEIEGRSFYNWDGVQAALPDIAQERYDKSRERMAAALEKVGVDSSIVDMVRNGESRDAVSEALSDDETWSDAQNDLATSGDVDLPQKFQKDRWDATREADDALSGLKNKPEIAKLPGAESAPESEQHPYLSRDKRFPDLEKMSDEEIEEAINEANDFKEKVEAGEASLGPGDAETLKAWLKAMDREKKIRAANLDAEDRKAARAISQTMYDIERGGMSFIGPDGKVISGDALDMKRAVELRSAAEKLDKIFNPDTSGGKAKGKLFPGLSFEVTEDGQRYPGGRVPGQIIIDGPEAEKLDPAKMEELGFTLDGRGRWVKDRPLGKPKDVEEQVSSDLAEVKALAEEGASSSQPSVPESIVELPDAPEAKEPPSPASSQSFDFVNVPEGAYKMNLDFFEPEGRVDEDSADYTDDPRVLAQKFSEEQLTEALAEALVNDKSFADSFLEQLDDEPSEDDEDAPKPKKSKPGPKPKKKTNNTATGSGKLAFDGGDEYVPAEALYLALQERGVDIDGLVADMYDSRAGDSQNRDALNESRGEGGSVPLAEIREQEPEVVADELDEILEEESVEEAEPDVYVSQRQLEKLNIAAEISAIDVDELQPGVRELRNFAMQLPIPADESEAMANRAAIAEFLAPALAGVMSDTASDSDKALIASWWGLFQHIDNGDGGVVSTGLREVAKALADYSGIDDSDYNAVSALASEIYKQLGSIDDFKESKSAFAAGEEGSEIYRAFAEILAAGASANQRPVFRGVDMSIFDEDFELYTTEGSVINFAPSSWTWEESTADSYAKRNFKSDDNTAGVVFRLDAGEATSMNIERLSWFFHEHEDVVWGQYVVDSVTKETAPTYGGETKDTYVVNLRPMTTPEWARYNANGDYSSLLSENEYVEMPEGYHDVSPDTYEPEYPEGDNYEGVPEGFTDSPLYLAEMWETNDLIEQLRAGVEDGTGFGSFEYPLDEGYTAQIPVEAIRDALQIQGFDTDEILRDVANAGDGVDADTETDEPDIEPAESIAADEIAAVRDETALSEFDISDWKQVGGQMGSNKGGTYEDADGNRYYVKYPKSDLHAQNETLASALYRAAGVDAAGIYLGRDGNGDLVTVSPMIDGATSDFGSRLDEQDYLEKVQDGFAVDAWLANWDVAGLVFDNVVTDADGNPVRVDPGGALIFRAQGAPKGGAFGNEVTELDTLRDPNKNAQSFAVFGSMSTDQLRESARKLLPMTPDKIEDMVGAIVQDPEQAKELSDKLKARRQYILDYVSLNDEQPETHVNTYVDDEKETPAGVATPEPAGVPDDYTPPAATVDEPSPEPEPESAPVADSYLSSDGTPLQIGMKVRSTKDGLEAEVVKFDKNPKYVFVKDASGKKIVRSTKTLEILTDSDESPASEPEAPEAPEAPSPGEPEDTSTFQSKIDALMALEPVLQGGVGVDAIADALGIEPAVDMYNYLRLRHPAYYDKNPESVFIPSALLPAIRDGLTSDGRDDIDAIVSDVVLNGPKAAYEYERMPISAAYADIAESLADGENGKYSNADIFDLAKDQRWNIYEAMYSGDSVVDIAPPGGYETPISVSALISVLEDKGWSVPEPKDNAPTMPTPAAPEPAAPEIEETPEPEPVASEPTAADSLDLKLPNMETPGSVVKSVPKSALEAIDYSGTVGDGVEYSIKGDLVSDYNVGGKYTGKVAGVTLTVKGKTFPIKDALKKAGYRYNGDDKSWSITLKPGMGVGTLDDALASIYGGLEKIGPVSGEHYTSFKDDNNDSEPEADVSEPEAPPAAAEAVDVPTPPPGAPTLPDANGNPIWVGAKVTDAQGNEGTVVKLQPNGTYVDVKFPDETKKARSIKKVVVSGTGDMPVAKSNTPKKSSKPIQTGAPAVVVDEPQSWNQSNFEDVKSMSGAIDYVRQDADSATRGASVATDAGDVEDLDVRVTRVLDQGGDEKLMLKYRLTSWAGAVLAKKVFGDPDVKSTELRIRKLRRDQDGLMRIAPDSAYKNGYGRTYEFTVDTDSGPATVILHRANTSDGANPSSSGPKAFHNLVQVVLPGNATEDDIAKVMTAAGVRDARPAVQEDARVLIENRVLSLFGKETNPTKNLSGPAREAKLEEIYKKWGFALEDIRVVSGADGRIEYRLPPEVAEKIAKATGVKAILHSITPPSETATGKLLYSGPEDERRAAWLEYYLELFGSPHDGLLSTTTRWTEGIGRNGMSSTSDAVTGGADYVFTAPKGYRPDTTVYSDSYNSGPRIVFRPEAVFERLDMYANQNDKFGKRSNTADIIKNITPYTYELMLKHRLDWSDLDHVLIPEARMRDDLIAALKARGIFSLGGIPIEQIFISKGEDLPDISPEERAKLKAAMDKIS